MTKLKTWTGKEQGKWNPAKSKNKHFNFFLTSGKFYVKKEYQLSCNAALVQMQRYLNIKLLQFQWKSKIRVQRWFKERTVYIVYIVYYTILHGGCTVEGSEICGANNIKMY